MNIKELAEQAGWGQGESYDDCIQCSPFDAHKFAELVAAHEREECAKLCEEMAYINPQRHQFAYAIRARSKA